jgi:hypothetical protein
MLKKITFIFIIQIYFLLIIPLKIQANTDSTIHAFVESQVLFSQNGNTPFWLVSNKYGAIPDNQNALIINNYIGKSYRLRKKLDWKFESETIIWGNQNVLVKPIQLYAAVRYKKLEFWLGRRKELYGLGDSTNTSGFYSWSGNAIPITKFQFNSNGYINFFKNWIGLNFSYSHGLFDNQGPVINSYLHQKSLYGRIGKPNNFLNFYAGINHQVTWGGESNVKSGSQFDNYPSSLSAYFYLVTLLKNRSIVDVDLNTSSYDANNQYGNHLGSIDIALNLKPKWGIILIYKQSAYETGRIAKLTTINDGLNGISLNFNNIHSNTQLIKNITFEYLYTANQGEYNSTISKLLKFEDPHLTERENYFNNGAGRGWYYLNRGIGTPFIILDNNLYFINVVKALYFSSNGIINDKLFWKFKISNSESTYASAKGYSKIPDSYFKKQISLNFKLTKNLNKSSQISTELGYDNGERLNNTIGLILSYKKLLL